MLSLNKKCGRLFWRLFPAFVGAIFLVVCFLGAQNAISGREGLNIYLSQQSFERIPKLGAYINQFPGYIYLIKLLSGALGENDYVFRMISCLAGGIAILLIFLCTKYLVGKKEAVFCTIACCLLPSMLFAGREVSATMLVTCFGLAIFYITSIYLNNHSKLALFAAIISSFICVALDFFAIITVAVAVIFALIFSKLRCVKISEKAVTVIHFALLLLCVAFSLFIRSAHFAALFFCEIVTVCTFISLSLNISRKGNMKKIFPVVALATCGVFIFVNTAQAALHNSYDWQFEAKTDSKELYENLAGANVENAKVVTDSEDLFYALHFYDKNVLFDGKSPVIREKVKDFDTFGNEQKVFWYIDSGRDLSKYTVKYQFELRLTNDKGHSIGLYELANEV